MRVRSLVPTRFIESTHPTVVAFARAHAEGAATPRDKAVALFAAVRDEIRYDPYTFSTSTRALRASYTLTTRRSWCVPKAIVLAACCRAQGIGARLGFADVKNHLSTKRLRQTMGTDIFVWHGYTVIELDGVWLKASPTFNRELCERFKLRLLEFDGTGDAILHPFDLAGHRHMEYLRFHGEYDDVPVEEMMAGFRQHYPALTQEQATDADFDADIATETNPDD